MRDPFPSKVKAQLVREAQIGFCIVAGLLLVFAYVTYNRLSGRDDPIPEYVQNSSPAQEVSPAPKQPAGSPAVNASARVPVPVLPSLPDRSPPLPTPNRIRHDHQVQLASANDSSPFEPAPHQSPAPFQPIAIKPIQDSSFLPSTGSISNTSLNDPDTNLRLSVPSGIALRNQLPATSGPPTQRDIALDAISQSTPPTKPPNTPPAKPPSEAGSDSFTPLSDKPTTELDVAIPDQPSLGATFYVTRPGDSFWSIAQSVYEDPRFFRALYQVNHASVPDFDNLKPRTKLAIPTLKELTSQFPDLCPPPDSEQVTRRRPSQTYVDNRIYITQSGDTLWEIARQKLGQASRYSEINHWNDTRLDPNTLPDTPLPGGVRLVLPVR